jgi:glycosyltransferase involved in cell wall biosynthesis
MTPLVSVLMPVFNATDTLPVALASLQAQTYENWECIVVDDGSIDHPQTVIQRVGDARIQFHRLDRNRGRGYARQHALEFARGRYVTFLDGDDWVCPNKFREQVDLLTAQPELAIVSTVMAISNQNGQLAGIRNSDIGTSAMNATVGRLSMPPLAFAPSMMATDLANRTGFDISFPIAEDVDFLLRALLGKRYAVLPAPLYVYREQGSTTLSKVSPALNYCCRMFMKQLDRYPVDCAVEIAKARGKQAVYHAAAALGLWEQIIARRSRPPTAAERQQYHNAWNTVTNIAHGVAVAVSGHRASETNLHLDTQLL